MKRTTKLVLDIVMGAVVPILILNNLTQRLGAPAAYVLSALVPVGWIFVDLLFITRRFNFITAYIGLNAIIRGMMAFWFVDGVRFALKDSISFVVAVVAFGGSVVIGKPIMRAFLLQSLDPDTPEREQALARLLRERPVARALIGGSLVLLVVNLLSGLANFVLNLRIVVAPFGTEQFNRQVAQVNAITRIALSVPEFLAFGVAFWLIYRALYAQLPATDSTTYDQHDFWELLREREAQQG
jgi:hypothetical protein